MKKYLILFLFLFLIGCRVQLVPAYDSTLESEIIQDAKATDQLYLKMIDAPAKSYSLYSADYLSIEAEINVLLLKNQSRKHADHLIGSISNLKTAFTQYKNEHKNADSLSDNKLKVINAYLKGFWSPVLIAEKALSKQK